VKTRRTLLQALSALALSKTVPAWAQSLQGTVRVGYVPVIGASALFVLDGAGWAREAGLAIKTTKFESGPNAIQALASGTLDALAIGVAPVAVARAKGLDVKIVAAGATGGSAFVASPELAEAFAVNDGRPARAFAAFRARQRRPAKLATLPPGGVPTVALHHWLWKVSQVDRADVTIAQMGIEAVQQAMLAGAVDGGTVLEPSATLVTERNPRLRRIVNAPEMFPDIPGVVFAITRQFEVSNPGGVETLVRLLVRATDLLKTEPSAAAPFVQAVLGGGLVDTATIARAIASPAVSYVADPRAIVRATEAMLSYQVELGDFPTAPPIAGLFDPAYYAHAATP
jgi:NitT/TauT family transport system substrate-binding protein